MDLLECFSVRFDSGRFYFSILPCGRGWACPEELTPETTGAGQLPTANDADLHHGNCGIPTPLDEFSRTFGPAHLRLPQNVAHV